MKKSFKYAIALTMGVALSSGMMTSCNDDDDDNKSQSENSSTIIAKIDATDTLEYNSANQKNWKAYMEVVAKYLKEDASTLYNAWTVSYNGGDNYQTSFCSKSDYFSSNLAATEQIVDGCIDIATEVGEAKIGDPLNLWKSGEYEDALYSVESWYSWHSRVDYSNNIESIKNAYYGSLNGSVSANSISQQIAKIDADLDKKVKSAIQNAIEKILAIPQPFRNHIASQEALAAQNACAELEELMSKQLKPALSKLDESTCEAINKNYVETVVVPTYKSLKEANEKMYDAVKNFNGNFETLCNLWIESRTFWEKSEAFLFGPVADLGLDPNMDSWPLDQKAIRNILANGDFSGLAWNDAEYDEDNDDIAAAQSIRGFHTLEYLIYKAGQPRTVK